MKSFFRTLLIIVGVVGALITTLIIFIIINIGSLITVPTTTIEEKSILHITLEQSIVESNEGANVIAFNPTTFEITQPIPLLRYIMAINSAQSDPRISAIFLEPSLLSSLNLSQLFEIEIALSNFKKSGKKVICYAESLSQRNYLTSTVASKIFLAPSGSVEWIGMSMQTPFFKDALNKLGIKAEVVRHGKYKSAVEPFTQTKMSEASRQQNQALLSTFWGFSAVKSAKNRGLKSGKLLSLARQLEIDGAESALKYGLVDSLLYRDQALKYISSTITDKEKPKLVGIEDYLTSLTKNEILKSENKIAIIYVDGELVSGESSENYVGSTTVCRKLVEARNDENIKAVVLRVNSPGGSALAADIIHREVELLQQSKPVVALFGEYAASGGYYISAPADCIMASPYTVTGSIGVFGLTFNAKEGLESKLGITFDGVQSSPNANINSIVSPLTKAQYNYLEKGVEDVYSQFVTKVAKGRNLTYLQVDSIAQGRVWSGAEAIDVGLVDKIGTFDSAISFAAQKCGLANNFDIKVIRDETDPITQFFDSFTSIKATLYPKELVEANRLKTRITKMAGKENIQTLMPYKLNIE